MNQKIGVFFIISLIIYIGIAVGLIITNPQAKNRSDNPSPIAFEALTSINYAGMPALQFYTARDGTELGYREYGSATKTDKVLILLHGSGWHSMQFYPLAKEISERGLALVITPDLRGHGFEVENRGDVDYIGQLEDDAADLIAILKKDFPDAKIILGGHSSGGGLVIRFAGSAYGEQADAFLLLAPFLKYNAPTTRQNSGGWAHPLSRRIVGLTMLNKLGIRWFNGLPVIQLNLPQSVLNSSLGKSATTTYSYRLNTSFAPRSNYGHDLRAMQQPFLLAAGLDDQAFIAEQYQPTISAYTASGQYQLLPGVGHIDLLTSPDLPLIFSNWLSVLE